MNITTALDLAIKKKEIGTTRGSYDVLYNGQFSKKECYMTNQEWLTFLNAMSPTARDEYKKGGGDELSEKNGRPPKMASYGSSSRMIYLLSRENADFHYEEKLPTTVGGKANLDGFCSMDEKYVFVEAKCHEPYVKKKNVVSTCYKPLYEFINTSGAGNLEIRMQPSACGRYMNVDYYAYGEKLERFDLKQMICHQLGIATGVLSGKLDQKQIDFLYLLYDPCELEIAAPFKAKINDIYHRTRCESMLVDFVDLFRAILTFLQAEYYPNALTQDELGALTDKFSFNFVSQHDYPDLIR